MRSEAEFLVDALGRLNAVGVDYMLTCSMAILHKLYWNQLSPSQRQLGDAAGVYAVQSDTLDVNYLWHWAASLGVQHDFEGLVAGKIKPKTT
jgi:hypothetical protein